MKTCVRCGESKPESEYYRDRRRVDGLVSACKACCRLGCAKSRALHADTNNARIHAWQAAHPEKQRAYQKASRARHADKNQERSKAWKAAHRAQENARVREWKRAHHTYENARMAAWRKAHPESWKAASSARRARKQAAAGRFTAGEWRELKAKYGGKCLCCGRGELEVRLTPDHVHPLARGGSNGIENIQPLCGSCNSSKGARTIDYRNVT